MSNAYVQKRNKVDIALEQYKMEVETENAKTYLAKVEQHEKAVAEFSAKFIEQFNALFEDICTFVDLTNFMNVRGWEISFNVIQEAGENDVFLVVFTPLHINQISDIKTMQVVDNSFMNSSYRKWSFGNNVFMNIDHNDALHTLNWLIETVGYTKNPHTEPMPKLIEDTEGNPKFNLPTNIIATDMTLLDYYAGVALPLFINDNQTLQGVAVSAYQYAEAMLEARKEYFS